jgi:hypothetical protein
VDCGWVTRRVLVSCLDITGFISTYISLHWLSFGSGDGFWGKFWGAYCPTLRPPRALPSRIKSRLCPVLSNEAPGSERSVGSALGMVPKVGPERKANYTNTEAGKTVNV